jgi:hypothetical protein
VNALAVSVLVASGLLEYNFAVRVSRYNGQFNRGRVLLIPLVAGLAFSAGTRHTLCIGAAFFDLDTAHAHIHCKHCDRSPVPKRFKG